MFYCINSYFAEIESAWKSRKGKSTRRSSSNFWLTRKGLSADWPRWRKRSVSLVFHTFLPILKLFFCKILQFVIYRSANCSLTCSLTIASRHGYNLEISLNFHKNNKKSTTKKRLGYNRNDFQQHREHFISMWSGDSASANHESALNNYPPLSIGYASFCYNFSIFCYNFSICWRGLRFKDIIFRPASTSSSESFEQPSPYSTYNHSVSITSEYRETLNMSESIAYKSVPF